MINRRRSAKADGTTQGSFAWLARPASGLRSLLKRLKDDDQGAVLVLVAAGMLTLGGFSALSIDVGQLYVTRGEIQNSADASALAGAQSLTVSSAEATAKARDWADKNGLSDEEIVSVSEGVDCDGATIPYTLTVRVKRNVDFTFARLLGFTDSDVTACATARAGSPAQTKGLVPLSVLEESINYDGTPTVLKFDAQDITNGNTMSLKLDGQGGAPEFEENLKFGAEQELCASETDPDNLICTASSEVDTEPGVKINATRNGINYRLDNTSTSCDTMDEVFQDRGDGTHGIRAGCNPFNGDDGSKRVMLIPVIDEMCNGRCTVTVKRFAIFWLEELGPCTGNNCEVRGTFVNVTSDIGGKLGAPDGDHAIVFARLVS